MGKVKNVVEKADSMIGKIPSGYALSTGQMIELKKGSKDWFHLIGNSFRFGYMQGVKATKAEMKKRESNSKKSVFIRYEMFLIKIEYK